MPIIPLKSASLVDRLLILSSIERSTGFSLRFANKLLVELYLVILLVDRSPELETRANTGVWKSNILIFFSEERDRLGDVGSCTIDVSARWPSLASENARSSSLDAYTTRNSVINKTYRSNRRLTYIFIVQRWPRLLRSRRRFAHNATDFKR